MFVDAVMVVVEMEDVTYLKTVLVTSSSMTVRSIDEQSARRLARLGDREEMATKL